MADAAGQRNLYSVSRLNREVRALLESGFARLWVEGEISNLSRPASGHLYFTLKDAGAQVSCALFRNSAIRMGFVPENGMQVLVRAQVSLYEARGNFQLIVSQMEEAGDGALRRAFEQLKNRLHSEGLFDDARKRPLPRLPRRIGVITSPSGAAVRDVLTVLRRRFPAIPVIIYPVQVQGAGAAQQIVAALRTAQQRAECDVLLLTRGGGSLEDLWPFNEEIVARAVYDCAIPVVSAVGHEIDVVITDFVADRRAPTPSAAAELLSPDRSEIDARLCQLENRLARLLGQHLQQRRDRLAWLEGRLQQCHPGRRLQQQAQRLDELEQRLRRAWTHRSAGLRSRLEALVGQLHRHSPAQQLQRLDNLTAQLAQRLKYCIHIQLSWRREKIAVLSRALDAVSPLATLQRGYSITLGSDGSIMRNASDAGIGDTLETRLAKGRLVSRVTEIIKRS
ncbi:MAG: exodeoxyribonuclease VII large subunit [Thiogranum sp.]|nr:exodeoxyribonuclease VII large subunit [Thiogranum sp.]